MLPFKPHVTVSQNILGSPLTLTDDSNYGTNSDGINDATIITRVITVYDKNNNLLATLNMTQDVPLNYPISGDQFLRFHLAFSSAVPVVYQNDCKFLSTRYYNNKQLDVASQLRCACPNERLLKIATHARELYNAAIDAFMTGDDVSADLNITDANTYINQPC